MKICVPVKTLKDFEKAQKVADIVEVWFDEAKEKPEKFFEKKKKAIIYKCSKTANELVIRLNPEFIDLDMKTNTDIFKKIKELSPKTLIIISHHDFKKTPSSSELKKIADKAAKMSADIIKIATFAKTIEDSLRMLEFLSNQAKKHKMICLCMGKNGVLTRTTGHLFGNALMYAALSETSKTADGQLTVKEFKKHLCL